MCAPHAPLAIYSKETPAQQFRVLVLPPNLQRLLAALIPARTAQLSTLIVPNAIGVHAYFATKPVPATFIFITLITKVASFACSMFKPAAPPLTTCNLPLAITNAIVVLLDVLLASRPINYPKALMLSAPLVQTPTLYPTPDA